MTNKKEPLSIIAVKTLLAVIIFAGVGTIIVGGGLLIGMQGEVSEPAKLSQEQPAKIVEEEKDETADWQTYRNEEFGFEIEYPCKIKKKEIIVGYNVEPHFEYEPTSLLLVEFPYLPFQEQSINLNSSSTDIVCWAGFFVNIIKKESSFSLEKIKQSHKKSEYIIIDKTEGVRRNEFIGRAPSGGGKEDLIWLPKDSEIYLLYYIVDKEMLGGKERMKKCLDKQKNTFNQILSSFKFIEK